MNDQKKETIYALLHDKRIVNVYDGRPDGSILIRLNDRTEIIIFDGIIRKDNVALISLK